MIQASDNPQQGNRGGQESGENNLHKSSRSQDSQRHQTTPEEEKMKQRQEEVRKDEEKDKFSPGEPDNYDADEFSTD